MKPIFDESVRLLVRVRFIRAVDLIFAASITAAVSVFIARILSGHAGTFELVDLFLVVFLFNSWLVALVFRVCYSVLQCRADVNTMVPDAAKLVHAYIGGVPQPTPPLPGGPQ
jgi:hypothetical protein